MAFDVLQRFDVFVGSGVVLQGVAEGGLLLHWRKDEGRGIRLGFGDRKSVV